MVDKKKEEMPEEVAMTDQAPEVAEAPEALNEMEAVTPEATEEIPEENKTGGLIAELQRFYPGEEITDANKEEMAVMTIQKLSGIQDNLIEVVDAYPEFGSFLSDIMNGMAPDEAAARNFDDMMQAPEGSPDWERINKGREERKAKNTARQERMSQLEKNKQVSITNAQEVIAELGLQEADAVKFLDWYDQLQKDQFDGLLTKEHMKALYKAYTYDDTLAAKDQEMNEAVETAKVAGRNEQIEMKKLNAETGDGIPKLSTGGKAPARKLSYAEKFFEGVV